MESRRRHGRSVLKFNTLFFSIPQRFRTSFDVLCSGMDLLGDESAKENGSGMFLVVEFRSSDIFSLSYVLRYDGSSMMSTMSEHSIIFEGRIVSCEFALRKNEFCCREFAFYPHSFITTILVEGVLVTSALKCSSPSRQHPLCTRHQFALTFQFASFHSTLPLLFFVLFRCVGVTANFSFLICFFWTCQLGWIVRQLLARIRRSKTQVCEKMGKGFFLFCGLSTCFG